VLIAAATAPAATSAAGKGWGRLSRFVAGAIRGAEDGELDWVLVAGTLGAGNFLSLVQNDLLETSLAILANVFVDGHSRFPRLVVGRLYQASGKKAFPAHHNKKTPGIAVG
jgi:hypothetical protein